MADSNKIKLKVMSMIQNNSQVSAIKLSTNYQYKTSGTRTQDGSQAIMLYGINKNGSTLIDTIYLETSNGYEGLEIASNTFIGILASEYPWIYLSYTPRSDLVRIVGQPILHVSVREYPDIIDEDVSVNAVFV